MLTNLNEKLGHRSGRVKCLRSSQRAAPLILSLVVLFVTLAPLVFVRSEPSQQQQSVQMRAGGQQSNELGQNSDFSSGALVEGLATLNGFDRGAYTNAKRARKMSAFMPMRGRKDGRDLVGVDSLRDRFDQQQQQQQQQFPESPSFASGGVQFVHESDPNDDDAGLARLISAADNYRRQQQQQFGPHFSAGNNAVPPQFFTRFESVARNQLMGANDARDYSQQQQQQQQRHAASQEQVQEPLLAGGPATAAFLATGSGNQQIMQAKLRRAFHPMRGKKSSLQLSAPFDQAASEFLGNGGGGGASGNPPYASDN